MAVNLSADVCWKSNVFRYIQLTYTYANRGGNKIETYYELSIHSETLSVKRRKFREWNSDPIGTCAWFNCRQSISTITEPPDPIVFSERRAEHSPARPSGLGCAPRRRSARRTGTLYLYPAIAYWTERVQADGLKIRTADAPSAMLLSGVHERRCDRRTTDAVGATRLVEFR